MGMFRFKPASQFVVRYHSVVSCALNMQGLISKKKKTSENDKDISIVLCISLLTQLIFGSLYTPSETFFIYY
jgi:hypothetical protein